MIASWRGLAGAAGVAVVLAVLVALDLCRAPGVVDRALVPGFAAGAVTALVWEREGHPALRVVRAGAGWELRAAGSAAAPLPADPAAVDEVLAALRGARWHRRGAAGAVHASLTVIAADQRTVLGIGAPIEGTDQAWLVVAGAGAVVDRWVVRALDRDALSLRIKAPLADIRRAATIRIAGTGAAVELAGHPRQRTAPDHLVVAAELAADLERALADLAIVWLPGAAVGPTGPTDLAITAVDPAGPRTLRVVLGEACPGDAARVAVATSAGDGCVERAAADAVARAAARLAGPAGAVVERRPIPSDVQRVVLADGAAFEVQPLRVAGEPADPARAAELYAALALPAEPAALPAAPATHHLVVTDRAGASLTLDVFAGGLVARHGEPIALRPAPGAWQLLTRPSRALRELALWTEEPTTVAALQIDGVRYTRGAVLGDWAREPAGRFAAAQVEALAALVAVPRADAAIDPPVIVHRVAITVTPPIGGPSHHVLELGALRPTGCPARAGRDAFLLPAVVCTHVAALAN